MTDAVEVAPPVTMTAGHREALATASALASGFLHVSIVCDNDAYRILRTQGYGAIFANASHITAGRMVSFSSNDPDKLTKLPKAFVTAFNSAAGELADPEHARKFFQKTDAEIDAFEKSIPAGARPDSCLHNHNLAIRNIPEYSKTTMIVHALAYHC